MNRIYSRVAAAAGLAIVSALVLAYPQPSPTPVSWELHFKYDAPRRIVVEVPALKGPRAYWYVPFTVTNNTKEERLFLPVFDMLAADGQVLRSDRNVPTAVFDAIKEREKDRRIEPLSKVTGRVLAGVDQARDSVAIWPETDRKMGRFSVFIGGLSGEANLYRVDEKGEYTQVEKMETDEKGEPKGKYILLRKTLQMDFEVAGDADKADYLKEAWIMR